jgi:PKHD-type hydroxylase
MNSWWQIWHNYLNANKCQEFIDDALKIQPMQAKIGFKSDAVNDKEYRRSKVRWLNRTAPKFQWMFTHMENLFRRANQSFGFDLNYFHEIQFTEYHEDYEGYYNWHEDLNWIENRPCQRKLSIVVQLTDPSEYEGGELELKTDQPPNKERLKQRGTAIVFPSFLKHRVTPVTKGCRYSLVSWYEGPPFR